MRYLIFILLLSSCVTRQEVDAVLFLNNFNSPEMKDLCNREPELNQHGFYRKLNNGKLEFMSICSPQAVHMISAVDTDVTKILDANLPKQANP